LDLTEKKQKPRDQTFEEPKYLRQLIETRAAVRVRMVDNQEYEGVIEYYDVNFLRLTREGAPNLFIFKQDIKYVADLNG